VNHRLKGNFLSKIEDYFNFYLLFAFLFAFFFAIFNLSIYTIFV